MTQDIKWKIRLLFLRSMFRRARQAIRRCGVQDLYMQVDVRLLAIVHNYTKTGYRAINGGLRNDRTKRFLLANRDCLCHALDCLGTSSFKTFRGVQLLPADMSRYVSFLNQGVAYSEKFFVSASCNGGVADAFAHREPDPQKVKCIFETEAFSVTYIDELSDWGPRFKNKSEQEVLFKPGTTFYIDRIEPGVTSKGEMMITVFQRQIA